MRLSLALGVAGFVLCSAGGAMAQQYQTTNGPVVYVPSTSGQEYYATGNSVPFYNNTAQPLSMDQLVAGKNAPSYNYNTTKPYNLAPNNFGNGGQGPLTGDQIQQMRAARDARAQQYEAEYMQRLADQNVPVEGMAATAQNAREYYNGLTQPEPQAKPKKKRLVYRQDANPLQAPPRLFNPDQ